MTERTPTREWPLVIFTVALQCAAGVAFAAALLQWNGSPDARPLAVAVVGLLVLGLLLSLFHVGRPRFAWRAVRNVGHSRLSREIALTLAFGAVSLIYAWRTTVPTALTMAVFGLAAVISSAEIYLHAGRPFWRSGWLPASFLATAVLLGGLTVVTVGGGNGITAVMIIAGAIVTVAAAAWMLSRFAALRRGFDQMELAPAFTPRHYGCLVLHIALTGALPLALLFGGGPAWLGPVTLLAAAIGAVFGRTMVYSLSERLPRF